MSGKAKEGIALLMIYGRWHRARGGWAVVLTADGSSRVTGEIEGSEVRVMGD